MIIGRIEGFMLDEMNDDPRSPEGIESILKHALEAHDRGDLEAAEKLYAEILKLDPAHFVATHCLGVICNQRGQYEAAAEAIGRALRINSRSAMAHLNLGIALRHLNRSSEALMHFQLSLVLQPGHADALFHRAMTLQALGQNEEALDGVDALISKQPGRPEGPFIKGTLLQGMGEHLEAMAHFDEALSLQPDYVDARVNRAVSHMALGRSVDAFQDCVKALRDAPTNQSAHENMRSILSHADSKVKSLIEQLKGHVSEGRYDKARWTMGQWMGDPSCRLECLVIYDLIARTKNSHASILMDIKAIDFEMMDDEFKLRLGSVVLSLIEQGWDEINIQAIQQEQLSLQIPGEPTIHEKTIILIKLADYWKRVVAEVPRHAVNYYDELMALLAGNLGDFEAANDMAMIYHNQINSVFNDHPGLSAYRYLGGDFLGMIGHTGLIDFHLKRIKLGWSDYKQLNVIVDNNQFIANNDFLECFADDLKICSQAGHPAFLPCTKLHVNSTFKEGDEIHWWPDVLSRVQRQWEQEGRPPLAKLTPEKTDLGWNTLTAMGVPDKRWMATIHIRDGSYRKDQDFDFRNSNLDNYLPAAKSIIDAGGYPIRVGDANADLGPDSGIYDYARSAFRSPFMDVFLQSKARFFLGTSSGLVMVPLAFGVPCIQVNVAPMATRAYSSKDLFLPKLYRRVDTGEFLSFKEAMKSPLGTSFLDRLFKEAGVETVENTAGEINEVVQEMIRRLDGDEADTDEDHQLQLRFNEASPDHWGGIGGRVGKAFLRKYSDLL